MECAEVTAPQNLSVWKFRMERREEVWEAQRPAILERMMELPHMPHNAVSLTIKQLSVSVMQAGV